MFSGTEFNFQQNLLSELQACLKGKFRHLHFMRYSSHIQKMLIAQRLHYYNLALSARTVSYCRFSQCSRYCSIHELKELLLYLAMMLHWNAYKVLQKPLWLPSIQEGIKTAPPNNKDQPSYVSGSAVQRLPRTEGRAFLFCLPATYIAKLLVPKSG